jgi:haloalkane dehalogenase
MPNLFPYAPHYFTQPDAQRQHYVDEGDAAAPAAVAVALHGNPTWGFLFRDVIRSLAPSRRVIVPDHLGMGLSDKPQNYPYHLTTHCENLTRLLDAVVPAPQKIDLIVHDWGGAIGMGWAVQHPERVHKIVAMNTAAFLAPHIPPLIALARVPLLGAGVVLGLNAFVRLALHTTTVKPLAPEVKRGYAAPYDTWAHRIGTLRFVQDVPLNAKHPTYAALKAIDDGLVKLRDKPLLLPWGGRDWCFHRWFFDEWQRRFPTAETLYCENASHYLLEDAGDEIIPAVEKFLQT